MLRRLPCTVVSELVRPSRSAALTVRATIELRNELRWPPPAAGAATGGVDEASSPGILTWCTSCDWELNLAKVLPATKNYNHVMFTYEVVA